MVNKEIDFVDIGKLSGEGRDDIMQRRQGRNKD